jgi:protein-L-isoaspartate(D-aspartate) O-methyltransferase
MQDDLVKNEHWLINDLIDRGYLKSENLINAMKEVHRFNFLRDKDRGDSALNQPISIGYKQTISQPLTVAYMLELLEPKEGERILDIGSGSGWTVALLSSIAGGRGRVYGIEMVPELVEFARANVSKYNFITKGIAWVEQGDGKKGLPESAPFDKILVSAAASELPDVLAKQLKPGGRMVIPIGKKHEVQDMVVIDKNRDGTISERRIPGFVFVPLV